MLTAMLFIDLVNIYSDKVTHSKPGGRTDVLYILEGDVS